MLSNHMLLDLYGVLVAIRKDPFIIPTDAYEELSALMDNCSDHNSIRILLRKYIHDGQSVLNFIYTDNQYASSFLCKDRTTLFILKWIMSHLMQLVKCNRIDQMTDFVDSVHFVPLLAYHSPHKITKRQLVKLLRKYTRKWKVKLLR